VFHVFPLYDRVLHDWKTMGGLLAGRGPNLKLNI